MDICWWMPNQPQAKHRGDLAADEKDGAWNGLKRTQLSQSRGAGGEGKLVCKILVPEENARPPNNRSSAILVRRLRRPQLNESLKAVRLLHGSQVMGGPRACQLQSKDATSVIAVTATWPALGSSR